uniref:Uncharacterized protein n=1 Tax=Oryza meridionalis TaxID=40149 RepID=A0A0E0D359_9ORYZ
MSVGVTFALVDDNPGVDEMRRVKLGGGELGEYWRVDGDPGVVEGKRGMVAAVVALVDGRWVDVTPRNSRIEFQAECALSSPSRTSRGYTNDNVDIQIHVLQTS